MKRHVHAPQRTVTVEDGTVRDLDGNELGFVSTDYKHWFYGLPNQPLTWVRYRTQEAAVFALVADKACPAGGPNRYDTGTRTR